MKTDLQKHSVCGQAGNFFSSLMHGYYRVVDDATCTLRAKLSLTSRVSAVLVAGMAVEVIESRVNSVGHTRMHCIALIYSMRLKR